MRITVPVTSALWLPHLLPSMRYPPLGYCLQCNDSYAPNAKKKNITKKREIPAQEKTKTVIGGNKASKGKATTNDHAGSNNPNYVLFKNGYGNICARYVGPYDGYIAWSIWVPKTLVANSKGPIAKWVPKTKH